MSDKNIRMYPSLDLLSVHLALHNTDVAMIISKQFHLEYQLLVVGDPICK